MGLSGSFFINGHGGNVATLKAAFSETYAHLADLGLDNAGRVRCQVANWYMARSVYAIAKELYSHQEGSHATPSEVALTQFAYPDHIKQAELNPAVAPSGYPIYSATDFSRALPRWSHGV